MGDRPGRRVLVTGAARGIGRDIVTTLGRAGYRVAVADISLDAHLEFLEDGHQDSVVDDLARKGVEVRGYEADVSDADALGAIAAELEGCWGGIDGVVCNAGGGSGPLDGNRAGSIDLEELRLVLDRNLIGTINTVQAVLPLLISNGGGSVVTMSSQNGLDPTPDGRYAHYGIAKAAVAHYTRYLARDIGRYGIRANCLAPGPIVTGRIKRRMAESAEVHEGFSNALRRLGDPQDVSGVVRFLLSEDAGFVTGEVIRVDGGLS